MNLLECCTEDPPMLRISTATAHGRPEGCRWGFGLQRMRSNADASARELVCICVQIDYGRRCVYVDCACACAYTVLYMTVPTLHRYSDDYARHARVGNEEGCGGGRRQESGPACHQASRNHCHKAPCIPTSRHRSGCSQCREEAT